MAIRSLTGGLSDDVLVVSAVCVCVSMICAELRTLLIQFSKRFRTTAFFGPVHSVRWIARKNDLVKYCTTVYEIN